MIIGMVYEGIMTGILMTRRAVLAGTAAILAFPPIARAEQPWTMRLVAGAFDGKAHHGGLHLKLAAGWKTYWRVPGAGGIPPSIEGSGANLKSFAFDCPLPRRYAGEEGESIGYKEEVLFPFVTEPQDIAKPVDLKVKAFVGVCETICIPVPFEQALVLEPSSSSSLETALIAAWRARVPQRRETGVVSGAKVLTGDDGKLRLNLAFPAAVDDVFVEGNALHYFGTPQWNGTRTEALMPVSGAKAENDLRNASLRVTVRQHDQGLEQMVRLV